MPQVGLILAHSGIVSYFHWRWQPCRGRSVTSYDRRQCPLHQSVVICCRLARDGGRDCSKQMCVCVFSSNLFWTSSSLDVPAGVIQEEGHTGFLIHLPSAVRALIFLARRIQPFFSLVDRKVEFCVLTI